MPATALVYPMCAMVALTAFVLVTLFRSRVRAVREKAVSAGYFKTYQGEREPEYAQKPARHFANLFEAPTLFFAACVSGIALDVTGWTLLGLAWTYVALRVAHAAVHLGQNKLRPRIRVYMASWVVLLAMWGTLAVDVALR